MTIVAIYFQLSNLFSSYTLLCFLSLKMMMRDSDIWDQKTTGRSKNDNGQLIFYLLATWLDLTKAEITGNWKGGFNFSFLVERWMETECVSEKKWGCGCSAGKGRNAWKWRKPFIGKETRNMAEQIMRLEDLKRQCKEVKHERDITKNTV